MSSLENIEQSLGVSQIRDWVRAKCRSEQGAAWVEKASFSKRFDQISNWLSQTRDMITLVMSGDIPNRHFYDLKIFLVRIRVEGTFLEGEEFLTVANSVRCIDEWISFLQSTEAFPHLSQLKGDLSIDASVVAKIEHALNENGEVRDSASPELAAIRKRMIEAERMARTALQRILRKSVADDFSTEESQVTLRDGRLVIPVKAEFKRNIAGLVHDESATGQTVFLEPSEALELNNEVRELKNRERREVIKILTSLADALRSQYQDLERGSNFLAMLDFIHAKASWAREFNAIAPQLQKSPGMEMHNGFHPILWQSHQQAGKSVVPLNILIDQNQRIVVVSGPNAGGKSVVLKTVGLLQYLVQSGFPVPVAEHSKFGVYDEILLDIGDTQSIEDDLSTYSAHLSAMKRFLQRANKKSLVLIDEFGKGTEPQFGGAIAEAILDNLNNQGAYGIITTHYQNLKDLAEKSHGMVNAAMKYDVAKLEPMFQVEIGKPGSSFAFEIAGKIGLPKEVVESAKSKIGSSQVDFDQSLSKLEKERNKFDKLSKKLEKEQKEAAALRRDYEELKELLDEEKKRIIREAKAEAKRLLKDANKDIERTIREIKESKADKEKTKKLRDNLEQKSSSIQADDSPKRKSAVKISEGDQVKVSGQEGVGEVVRLKGKEAEVQFGLLKSFVKLDRLEKVGGPRKKQQEAKRGKGINRLDTMASFSHELSIIGMRGEEALPKLDSFIDNAIMLGVNEVRIIHGKGHGILRDLVRGQLKDHPHVMDVQDDHADRGGSGISIVSFR